MATVVATITSICVANAAQTITTPNAAFVSYSLAGGANSAPITPATNRSVLVMGCCTMATARGAGQVSLLHLPSSGMTWVGLESATSTGTAGTGVIAAGTHIVWVDSSHHVDIQVAGADTICVHSSINTTLAGNVTLIW
jgi:hypothetical protein